VYYRKKEVFTMRKTTSVIAMLAIVATVAACTDKNGSFEVSPDAVTAHSEEWTNPADVVTSPNESSTNPAETTENIIVTVTPEPVVWSEYCFETDSISDFNYQFGRGLFYFEEDFMSYLNRTDFLFDGTAVDTSGPWYISGMDLLELHSFFMAKQRELGLLQPITTRDQAAVLGNWLLASVQEQDVNRSLSFDVDFRILPFIPVISLVKVKYDPDKNIWALGYSHHERFSIDLWITVDGESGELLRTWVG
jgi:hypothetical protein